MKLYIIESSSNTLGFFSNKKEAMSFLRYLLKNKGETETRLTGFKIPVAFYPKNIIGWAGRVSNDVRQMAIEYIIERLDGELIYSKDIKSR